MIFANRKNKRGDTVGDARPKVERWLEEIGMK